MKWKNSLQALFNPLPVFKTAYAPDFAHPYTSCYPPRHDSGYYSNSCDPAADTDSWGKYHPPPASWATVDTLHCPQQHHPHSYQPACHPARNSATATAETNYPCNYYHPHRHHYDVGSWVLLAVVRRYHHYHHHHRRHHLKSAVCSSCCSRRVGSWRWRQWRSSLCATRCSLGGVCALALRSRPVSWWVRDRGGRLVRIRVLVRVRSVRVFWKQSKCSIETLKLTKQLTHQSI